MHSDPKLLPGALTVLLVLALHGCQAGPELDPAEPSESPTQAAPEASKVVAAPPPDRDRVLDSVAPLEPIPAGTLERRADPAPLGPAAPAVTVLDPAAILQPELAHAVAPPRYRVAFETTKGRVVVQVDRSWAPHGADRLFNLASVGFFDGNKVFRVVKHFVAQFGLHGEPAINSAWRDRGIADDPVRETNRRGTLVFAATAVRGSRTTQLFFNLRDNPALDRMGFAPVGEVIEGLSVLDALHSGYGEGPPRGLGPSQSEIAARGDAYLLTEFPELDGIERARVVLE